MYRLEHLSLRSGSDPTYPLIVSTDRLNRLAAHWPKLHSLDVMSLQSTLAEPVPVFPNHLKAVALTAPDCNDHELLMLLRGSVGTLETLKLSDLSTHVTRAGLHAAVSPHAATLLDVRSRLLARC
jgi:hypothetical protein